MGLTNANKPQGDPKHPEGTDQKDSTGVKDGTANGEPTVGQKTPDNFSWF